jgi:hypothetical protein
VLHNPSITWCLIKLLKQYCVRKTNYEAPYKIFFTPLIFYMTHDQISSWAICSQTPSLYVLHLVWETNLYPYRTSFNIIVWHTCAPVCVCVCVCARACVHKYITITALYNLPMHANDFSVQDQIKIWKNFENWDENNNFLTAITIYNTSHFHSALKFATYPFWYQILFQLMFFINDCIYKNFNSKVMSFFTISRKRERQISMTSWFTPVLPTIMNLIRI